MKLSELKRIMLQPRAASSASAQEQMLQRLRELGYEPGSFYQELEMDSDFVDTHQDTSFSNSQVNLHSHAFFELLYCTNTCGAEYLVGTERYSLQKGDIIGIPPGISHRPLLPEHMTLPYKRYVIWVNPDFVERLSRFSGDDHMRWEMVPRLMRTAGTPWEFLGDVFAQGVKESEQQRPGWETAVLANTMTLFVYLNRMGHDHSARPLRAEKPELVDAVMNYIEQNLARRITLSEIAHHFYVSESTISQSFRNKMGISVYHYVTQRRLISAKILIAENVPLEQVATHVGFADYSTFYRAFKQEYGISPRQYRCGPGSGKSFL